MTPRDAAAGWVGWSLAFALTYAWQGDWTWMAVSLLVAAFADVLWRREARPFRAVCDSCGWRSARCASQRQAENAARAHAFVVDHPKAGAE